MDCRVRTSYRDEWMLLLLGLQMTSSNVGTVAAHRFLVLCCCRVRWKPRMWALRILTMCAFSSCMCPSCSDVLL